MIGHGPLFQAKEKEEDEPDGISKSKEEESLNQKPRNQQPLPQSEAGQESSDEQSERSLWLQWSLFQTLQIRGWGSQEKSAQAVEVGPIYNQAEAKV